MDARRHWILFPGVLSILLIVLLAVSYIVAGFALDAFAIRVDGADRSHHVPGFTYANTMIMKGRS